MNAIKNSEHHDNETEFNWVLLLQCSNRSLSEKTQLAVLELLLNQSSDIKLEFVDIAKAALKRCPDAVPNVIVSKMLPHGLHYNAAADAYLDLLLEEKVVLEPGLLRYLTTEVGEVLMHSCNVGGTEGAKCSTEHQLSYLGWTAKLLELVIVGGKGKLVDSLKNDGLDGLIKWYLLNNSEELNPINPAYRTPSYDMLTRIEAKVFTIFKSAESNTAQLLKRIF